jgi:tRNA (guanine37-N1)-methyltransferase
MIFDILSIFPGIFDEPLSASMVGIAQERNLVKIRTHDLRDHTEDRHRTTDDDPYGGGPGMVMKSEPILKALDAIQSAESEPGYVVFLTPGGVPFTQRIAEDLVARDRVVLVCGRYEGFDERVFSAADLELSIGDYVLSGGEIAAMAVVDAVTRLVPGVLGDDQSNVDESFAEGLLEYPQYTRPRSIRGMEVPEVLLSGDHARIARWRREQAVRRTARVRPDLLARVSLDAEEGRIARDELDRATTHEER